MVYGLGFGKLRIARILNVERGKWRVDGGKSFWVCDLGFGICDLEIGICDLGFGIWNFFSSKFNVKYQKIYDLNFYDFFGKVYILPGLCRLNFALLPPEGKNGI